MAQAESMGIIKALTTTKTKKVSWGGVFGAIAVIAIAVVNGLLAKYRSNITIPGNVAAAITVVVGYISGKSVG